VTSLKTRRRSELNGRSGYLLGLRATNRKRILSCGRELEAVESIATAVATVVNTWIDLRTKDGLVERLYNPLDPRPRRRREAAATGR
jgi:hypothetical protein